MTLAMGRLKIATIIVSLFAVASASAQSGWFQPSLLERPDVRTALQSVDNRTAGIVDEWIKLTEMPAPTGQEQARAAYIRAEMQQLGLSDIKTDDISNVSGVRKGTGGGPTVVFAAHTDTVFPKDTDLRVKREGDILRAPGIGDDTGNLMATLEMFRALKRGGVQTKGDLIFLASVQEEAGLLGAKHWLETSGYKPDLFVAIDLSSNEVWYGALRITQYKFFYTSPGAHTMESRGGPSPARAVAKAIEAVYGIPLPPIAAGLDTFKLPVMNVGMLGGGTVINAVPRESWFTVDLRSLDTATQDQSGARRRLRRQERRGAEWRRLPDGTEHGHRLLEGPAGARAPAPSAGAGRAGDREPLPQAGHAGDRPGRHRLDRCQYRREHGHPRGRRRRPPRPVSASAPGIGGSQQHRAGDQIADRSCRCVDKSLIRPPPTLTRSEGTAEPAKTAENIVFLTYQSPRSLRSLRLHLLVPQPRRASDAARVAVLGRGPGAWRRGSEKM